MIIAIILGLIILLVCGIGIGSGILSGIGVIFSIGGLIINSIQKIEKNLQRKEENDTNLSKNYLSDYSEYLDSIKYNKYKETFNTWIISYSCNKNRTFFQIRNKFIEYLTKYNNILDNNVFRNIDFDLCIMSWLRILLKQKKLIIKTNGFQRKYYTINKNKLNRKELIIYNEKIQKRTNKNLIDNNTITFVVHIISYINHSQCRKRKRIRKKINRNTYR